MEKLDFRLHTPFDQPSTNFIGRMVCFIAEYSNEYKNEKAKIRKSIDYALKGIPTALGGYVLTLHKEEEIVGISVLNKTGLGGIMSDYMLSHLVIHPDYSGVNTWQEMLLNKSLNICNGDVTLLIKANNSLVDISIDHGFDYQRLEMVYIKSSGETPSKRQTAQQGG